MIIIGMIVGYIVLAILCERLDKKNITLGETLKNKTRTLGKNKKIWQYVSMILIILMILLLTPLWRPPAFVLGCILGSTCAIIDFVFETSFYDKSRNSLR